VEGVVGGGIYLSNQFAEILKNMQKFFLQKKITHNQLNINNTIFFIEYEIFLLISIAYVKFFTYICRVLKNSQLPNLQVGRPDV
jgi:hypothetical protein